MSRVMADRLLRFKWGFPKCRASGWITWTDEQRRAYALAHNKTAELSEWDFNKLEEELAHLQIDGIDMAQFDFDLSGIGEVEKTEKSDVELHETYQLIIDCESENDMQQKYEVLQEAGIECRVSTL